MSITTKLVAASGFALLVAACSDAGSTRVQTADLGTVLDRTAIMLQGYQDYLNEEGIEEVTDEHLDELRQGLVYAYNVEPFYDKPVGVSLKEDASFLGYVDANMNDTQDVGESDIFTVEIDEENERLIATDTTGNSTGLRVSGTGLLAGYVMGRLITRQRGAGVTRSAFNSRTVGDRSSYRAPASARSRARTGGSRVGK